MASGNVYAARLKGQRVSGRLGRGGSATVNIVGDIPNYYQSGRPRVGLSQVHAQKLFRKCEVSKEDIENELAVIRKVEDHDHIVKFVGMYETDDGNSFVIQFTPAADMNLKAYLNNERLSDGLGLCRRDFNLHQEVILRWINCLSDAIHHLHKNGVTHRDIKPQNILVHYGNILVADFGISRLLDAQTDVGDEDVPGLATDEDGYTTHIGTLKYVAPEAFEEGEGEGPIKRLKRVDSKADVFSLGCVFLEMLKSVSQPILGSSTPFPDPGLQEYFRYMRTCRQSDGMKALPAQGVEVAASLRESRHSGEGARLTGEILIHVLSKMITEREDRQSSEETAHSLERIGGFRGRTCCGLNCRRRINKRYSGVSYGK